MASEDLRTGVADLRFARTLCILLVAALALPLAPGGKGAISGVNEFTLPADTHTVILRLKTEGAGCIRAGFVPDPVVPAPYHARHMVFAVPESSFLAAPVDAFRSTPLSVERTAIAIAMGFQTNHREGAYRDHVSVGGYGWSEENGMNEHSFDERRGGFTWGACWDFLDIPEPVRHEMKEWFVYLGSSARLDSMHFEARESDAHRGSAVVVDWAVSTSSQYHVSPTWEWDAIVDRQASKGSETVLAEESVEVEHGFIGALFSLDGHSTSHWESPEGRTGANVKNCANLCGYVNGRDDAWFIHGNEPGEWRFSLDAMKSESYHNAALMWMDLPEPEFES